MIVVTDLLPVFAASVALIAGGFLYRRYAVRRDKAVLLAEVRHWKAILDKRSTQQIIRHVGLDSATSQPASENIRDPSLLISQVLSHPNT